MRSPRGCSPPGLKEGLKWRESHVAAVAGSHLASILCVCYQGRGESGSLLAVSYSDTGKGPAAFPKRRYQKTEKRGLLAPWSSHMVLG